MNTLIEISNPVYYVICAILSILVLVGIAMMSKVKTAARGNALSATAMGLGVIVTLLKLQVVTLPWLIGGILIGGIIGTLLYTRVKMIQMPQMVALLNGIGGGASALVGALTLFQLPVSNVYFTLVTAFLAIIIGMLTLVGSLVAAGKLHRVLPQKSVVWPFHNVATSLTLIVAVFFLLIGTLNYQMPNALIYAMIGTMLFSALFGLYFSIRVGGADMPITISLLNSLSGVAGAIAGMAIGDIFLVAVGGVVGASGLLLTQIMCRAMNRSLVNILIPHGKSKAPAEATAPAKSAAPAAKAPAAPQPKQESSPIDQAVAMLRGAKRVIIVPGYGMALAQAMLEYIDEAIGAKTLFSTHYHELTELAEEHQSMRNVHVDVREEKNEIEFRYRVIEGKADKSYGINVAKLAHLPKVVLDRASQLLLNFENQDNNQNYQPSLFVMDQVQPEKSQLLQQLQELDIDSMTPRDALDCLYELKKLSEKIES